MYYTFVFVTHKQQCRRATGQGRAACNLLMYYGLTANYHFVTIGLVTFGTTLALRFVFDFGFGGTP